MAQESHIFQESEELSVGENVSWVGRILVAFPAFGVRNYRLYFIGQLVSLVGTWLQWVAEGWLILQLTNSAFLLGVVAAAGTLPFLLFSLFAGVIVDRFDKRQILLFTQHAAMLLALILGIMVWLHIVNVWLFVTIVFLLGTVNALDIPARASFIIEVVGKETMPSALAINSGMFNAARVIGPAIAGFLIAYSGTAGAFILNGLSYIAAIVSLYMIRSAFKMPLVAHENPFKAIHVGIKYAFAHPIIKMVLLFTSITSIFGWSYSTLLSYVAKNIYHVGARELGYLYAATGVGALAAAFIVSAYGKKVNNDVLIFSGCMVFTVSVILFALVSSWLLALPLLFLAGVGLLVQFTTMNIMLQHLVDDNMRGRVNALYSLMFIGLFPIGNFQVGFMAEHFGARVAIIFGAAVTAAFGILVFTRRHAIRKKHHAYNAAK